jgi:hypothetical protein
VNTGIGSGDTPTLSNSQAWYQFEFDDIYTFESLWVWNYNKAADPRDFPGRSVKETHLRYSIDGVGWTTITFSDANGNAWPKSTGLDDYTGFSVVFDDPINAKYIKSDNCVPHALPYEGDWRVGLSEIQFNIVARSILGFETTEFGALENYSPAFIPVTLSHPIEGQTYTVDYDAIGGTAGGNGEDYILEPNTLTFNPGETTKMILIDVNDDGIPESDETIILELSNPTGPNSVLGISQHTYTIFDALPTVEFDANSSDGSEDVTPAMIEVSLPYPSGETITVDYNVTGGTATAGGIDYNLPAGTIFFEPGETTESISIDVVADLINEANPAETIVLTLSNPINATLGSISQHIYTILDNEPGAPFDGLTWYHSSYPPRLLVNTFGELEYPSLRPSEQINVQLPPMRLTDVGDVVEVAYMYKGEGPTDGSTSETNITIPSGTGDLRTGLFDSNGQAHIDHDGYEYRNPIWCGYKGYQVRLSPHTPTGSYAGRFAKRREPFCDSCDSLLQKAQGCWGSQYDLEQQPKINGFGLPVGEWSLLTLRLERTAPGTVVFTATLNDVTYTYTDNDPNEQAQNIDELAMYFANNRPFDLVTLAIVQSRKYAYNPHPASGANDVEWDVVLSWSAGDHATSHDVYFGTDFNDVNDANTTVTLGVYAGNQSLYANSYDPCGLEFATTYYWRIDENSDANLWKGSVWNFRTANYVIVDDMEDYTGFVGENPISLGPCGWECGFTNGTGSFIDLWTEPPTRGTQSMRYGYDNSFNYGLGYYAEIKSQCLDPCDWTTFNVKSLTLWFYGDPDNDANATEQMYVAVEDDNNTYAEVRYGDHGR